MTVSFISLAKLILGVVKLKIFIFPLHIPKAASLIDSPYTNQPLIEIN